MSKNPSQEVSGSRRMNIVRRAAAPFMVVALGVGAAACDTDHPSKETHFASYTEASVKLGKLAHKYGERYSVSDNTEGRINGALEAAIPLFKKDIADRMGKLVKSHRTSTYRFKEDGEIRGLQIDNFRDDDGNQVHKIEVTGKSYAKDPDTYLTVTHKKDGGVEIGYSKWDPNGGYSMFIDELDTDGNSVNVFSEFDVDGNLKTYKDTDSNLTEFDGDFGDWASPGPDVDHVVMVMQDIDKLLANATHVADTQPQYTGNWG